MSICGGMSKGWLMWKASREGVGTRREVWKDTAAVVTDIAKTRYTEARQFDDLVMREGSVDCDDPQVSG